MKPQRPGTTGLHFPLHCGKVTSLTWDRQLVRLVMASRESGHSATVTASRQHSHVGTVLCPQAGVPRSTTTVARNLTPTRTDFRTPILCVHRIAPAVKLRTLDGPATRARPPPSSRRAPLLPRLAQSVHAGEEPGDVDRRVPRVTAQLAVGAFHRGEHPLGLGPARVGARIDALGGVERSQA